MSISQALSELGVARFPSEQVKATLSPGALAEFEWLNSSFGRLVQDRHMGDGGRYRFRRFSRFLASPRPQGQSLLTPLSGHTILQDVRDNPLNGGVARTYEPLEQAVEKSLLLSELIRQDMREIASFDQDFFSAPVVVGVHQVRILAYPDKSGKPTPEGVHRDAESYTFQHFWAREGVSGGEFRAYDSEKNSVFSWLQQSPLDSVLFLGSTWHSASPIECLEGRKFGYRDVFLIDFDSAI